MGTKSRFSILKSFGLAGIYTFLLVSCGGNFYETMSSKTSHQAMIEDIRALVNGLRFDEAIELIESSTSLEVENRDEKILMASAYAGACGITFADIFESLETASGSPMMFMMSAFTDKIVQPSHCSTAQGWIEAIGDSANRTTSENVGMFLVGFGKVGTNLRNRADTSASGTGDGTIDAGYDSCDDTKLPLNEVKEIITGFGLMMDNIAAMGSSVSSDMSGSLDDVNMICGALGMNCNATDPADIPDNEADLFRNAIKSDSTSQLGIEDCDPLTPFCCP